MLKHNETLTAERVRFLFNYNPATGDLLWRNPTSHRMAVGERAGVVASNGRRYVAVDGIRHIAHRIAWLYVHGSLPNENITAKNGNYDDLRLENLAPQSFAETAVKNIMRRSNTSGVRGVIWDKTKGKWRAEITRDYQKVHLGRFNTQEEAQDAYNKALRDRTAQPFDPEDRRRVAAQKLQEAVIRRLWKRTLRDNGGVCGWDSYAAFAADVSAEAKPHTKLVPTKKGQPVGPSNYAWAPNSPVDRKTPEGRLAAQRLYRAKNPAVAKDSDLRKAFGITLATYNAMLEVQKHVCDICKQPEVEVRKGKLQALGVDHCHKTGVIRGLLCIACNSGIARFKDNPDYTRAATAYLEKHATASTSVPAFPHPPDKGALDAHGRR